MDALPRGAHCDLLGENRTGQRAQSRGLLSAPSPFMYATGQIAVLMCPSLANREISKASILISADAVPLESILRTEELRIRPSRPPQYEEENRALVALASALADSRVLFCKRWLIKSTNCCMPIRRA